MKGLPGKAVVSIAMLSLVVSALATQSQAPHLEGKIHVDIDRGLLKAQLCLSRLPESEGYDVLLNRGVNIRNIRDADSGELLRYSGFHNAPSAGDATRYTVTGRVGSEGFCIEYVGAYPVYRVDDEEKSVLDWKGQVAFDGRTVRAAEQTRFYPVLLDPATGFALDMVSYDIEVSCIGKCTAIYLSGSPPAEGNKARFTSQTPRPLLLYAGHMPARTVAGSHFVGADITLEDANRLNDEMSAIADALEAYIGIPYEDKPAFLSFAAVSDDREIGETSWMFVTWPTVALDGRVPFSSLLTQKDAPSALDPEMQRFLSHEMGHYYFLTLYMPRGPLLNFLLESTAEFLALKTTQKLMGQAEYVASLRDHYQAVSSDEVTPLNKVQQAAEISGNYPYSLGPLLLVALESYTSEETVRQLLAGLVSDSPREEVDYDNLRHRIAMAGASEEDIGRFESECLLESVAESCLQKVIVELAGRSNDQVGTIQQLAPVLRMN